MIKFLKQLWFLISVDCETSAHLTSDSFDRPLNWSEHWGMKLHRIICSKSRVLDQQMEFLNAKIVHQLNSTESAGQQNASIQLAEIRLSSQAKSRILQHIRNMD